MTKKIILASLALSLTGLLSCKKDYTCECTVDGFSSGSTSTTIHATKKDAETACKSGNTSTTLGGITMTTTCKLK